MPLLTEQKLCAKAPYQRSDNFTIISQNSLWLVNAVHTLDSLKAGHLTGIHRLKIAEGLTEFPHEIFSLADTLEILDLSDNKLSSLPNDFGQLSQLKILFLSQNEFDSVPEVLKDCPNLSMIGFKSNPIKFVPENALPLSTRWLILTDNQIEVLPESMGQLTELQKVMLAGNQIQRLPDSMQNCRKLELLRISANQLSELPNWLLDLPKLSWLAFAGNPLTQEAIASAVDLPLITDEDIELHELLGAGASGHIHRATTRHHSTVTDLLPDELAVKLFKGEITSDGYPDDELQSSLRTGHHPNLVHIMARYENEQQKGLVMQRIPKSYSNLGFPPNFDTCTRDTFDEDFTLSIEQILRIAVQIAGAAEHLHAHGLNHGDLYAHNVLINEDSDILLSDYGAASRLPMLSPQQVQKIEQIEARAFGCLLDDLLLQCATENQASPMLTEVSDLRDLCWHESPSSRPLFTEISKTLHGLESLLDLSLHQPTAA